MHKNKNPTKISDSFLMFSLLSGVASYKSWRDRRASWHPSSHRPAWAHASPVPANPVPKASMLRPAMLGITPSLDEKWIGFLGKILTGNLSDFPDMRLSGFNFPKKTNPLMDGWTCGSENHMDDGVARLDWTQQTSWNKICNKHEKS